MSEEKDSPLKITSVDDDGIAVGYAIFENMSKDFIIGATPDKMVFRLKCYDMVNGVKVTGVLTAEVEVTKIDEEEKKIYFKCPLTALEFTPDDDKQTPKADSDYSSMYQ